MVLSGSHYIFALHLTPISCNAVAREVLCFIGCLSLYFTQLSKNENNTCVYNQNKTT